MKADIVDRLRAPMYREPSGESLVMDATSTQAAMDEAAGEIARLRTALSSCAGYMLNAKIDLETGTPKRTTLNTLEGGIRIAKAAIASTSPSDHSATRAES